MFQNLYRRLAEKLVKKYRVELIDDITLYQTRQFIIKPVTIIMVASILLISIVVGTAAVVVYTPTLHSLIPDYQNPDSVRINQEAQIYIIDSLLTEVDKRDKILSKVQQIVGIEQAFPNAPTGSSEERSLPIVDGAGGRNAIEWEDPIRKGGNEDLVEEVAKQPASVPPIVQVVSLNRARNRNPLKEIFPPIEEGELRNGFSKEESHYGVDIVAKENTLIRSVLEGNVVISEYSDDNGWVIGVLSADELMTFYKHNSRLLKQVGSYVFAGEPIAVIGNSGENSTGPHLHLEIWHHGLAVDPANYLKFN